MEIHSYEYAGFEYDIMLFNKTWIVTPKLGQHPASDKEKHKRAALECFLQDTGGQPNR